MTSQQAGSSRLPQAEWLPGPVLIRLCLVGGTGLLAALAFGSPAMVVLVAAWVVWAALAAFARPRSAPDAQSRGGVASVVEGDGIASIITLGGAAEDDVLADAEHVVRVVGHTRYVARKPVGGVAGALHAVPKVALSPRRWGRHFLPDEQVVLTSRWAGYRWGPVTLPGFEVHALPATPAYTSRSEAPQPVGLVGANRSRRIGDGTEFAGIREFHAGDRLRRVNWRVSLRTGRLHAVTTRSEEDSGVLILVDALADHGVSGGVDGAPSSLDLTVRAAAALAEHHLRAGDRVGLRVVEWRGNIVVAPGFGERHLRRLLGTLARINPGEQPGRDLSHQPIRVLPGTVVFILSPMLHESLVTLTGMLSRSGLPVVVVDTLPPSVRATDEVDAEAVQVAELAWRMRRADREALLGTVARTGTPVVAWRGPGSLDEVLHRLARRAALPRPVAR